MTDERMKSGGNLNEDWGKETLKDWEEKMNDIGAGVKLTEDEYIKLRKEGKIN